MLNLRNRADAILAEMVLSSPSVFGWPMTPGEQLRLTDIIHEGLRELALAARRQVAEGVMAAFQQGEEPEDA